MDEEDEQAETFSISDGGIEHEGSNAQCHEGWCDGESYPKPCECGGLVHADWGDYVGEGFYLETKCDQCGEPE